MRSRADRPLEKPIGEAWGLIRLRRWGTEGRVTQADTSDLNPEPVCRNCGRTLGRKHREGCSRRAT